MESEKETGASTHIALLWVNSGVNVEIASASWSISQKNLFRLTSNSRGAFTFHELYYQISVKAV